MLQLPSKNIFIAFLKLKKRVESKNYHSLKIAYFKTVQAFIFSKQQVIESVK